MFQKLFAIKSSAWELLIIVVVAAICPRLMWQGGIIDSHDALYVAQPLFTGLAAIGAHIILRGQRDRLRHKSDKAFVVGSVISVWFVIYFLTGLVVTFVHNAVASSIETILLNICVFGITAAAIEYIRYSLLLLVGRRNALWFGIIVSLILAMQQIALLQIGDTSSAVEVVKFLITFVVPAIINNMLLGYLSTTVGLSSQLVYGLGIVAATILPPIIPKYDWYMTSMSSIILAMAVYVIVDRSNVDTDEIRSRHHYRRHSRFAFDAMFGLIMIALILFMTGAFTYKPVVIMSNSMLPVFSRGSMVVVQQVRNPMDINIGDIIQYEADKKTITHRVVAIDTAEDDSGDRIFTTKGDNNPSRDPPVAQSHIIGIIRSSVPFIGYPTVWLREISQKH